MTDFGVRLRELRDKRGMTQAELGVQVNRHQRTVSTWELGTRSMSEPMLRAVAWALDVTVAELMGEDADG